MKNKKSLYVLLPAAGLLWGYIVYLVVSGMGGGGNIARPQGQPMAIPDSLVLGQDSFSLSLDYEDPFLKKTKPVIVNNTPKRAPTASPKPNKVAETPSVNWPTINYGGSITGAGSRKEVVILIIGNEEVLAKEGDVHKGVKINHIAPQAIGLEYKGAAKTISR